MIGAKDILIKITGNNAQFKTSMAGADSSMKGFSNNAKTSMAGAGTSVKGFANTTKASSASTSASMAGAGTSVKGFASTTQASTAVAATSTKAMSISMAASLAVATLGITAVIGGVVALVGALGKAGAAAVEDQEATSRTIAALESEGIAFDSVSEKIFKHIEALEELTGIGDTDLQNTFTAFVNAGMNVEEALQATSAASRLAVNGVMTLEQSTKALTKEFTGQESKLKDTKVAGEDYDEVMKNIFATLDDGTLATNNIQGKMKDLSNQFMNVMKPEMEKLIPVIMDLLNSMIWGAENVLPVLIHMFKMLIIPVKFVITEFKVLINTAKAVWEALNGNFDVAKALLQDNVALAKQFNEESKNTILNIEEQAKVASDFNNVLSKAKVPDLDYEDIKIPISYKQEPYKQSNISGGVGRVSGWSKSDVYDEKGNWISPTPQKNVEGAVPGWSGTVSSKEITNEMNIVNTENIRNETNITSKVEESGIELQKNLDLHKRINEETKNINISLKAGVVVATELGDMLNINKTIQDNTLMTVSQQNNQLEIQLSLRERILSILKEEQRVKSADKWSLTNIVGGAPINALVNNLISGTRSGI